MFCGKIGLHADFSGSSQSRNRIMEGVLTFIPDESLFGVGEGQPASEIWLDGDDPALPRFGLPGLDNHFRLPDLGPLKPQKF